MTYQFLYVFAIVLLPVVSTLFIIFKNKHRRFFYTVSLAVPLINIGILLSVGVIDSPIFVPHLPFFVFSLDRFSYMITLLINLALFLTILYSMSYLRYNFENKKKEFYFFLYLATSASLAAGLAGNIVTLFLFYMVNIPTIYPLIRLRGSKASNKAARIYAASTFIPGLLLIIPLTWYFSGNISLPFQEISIQKMGITDFQASLLLFFLMIGFSKTCVAPFHYWLPITSCAPAPVSGLIHTVGAVQTACIGIFKIAFYIYGSEYLGKLNSNFFHTGWLIYLCGGTAVYTAYRAYKTNDLKERFSNSTVGQLSYILSSILIGSEASFLAATIHIVTHSIAKLNLFFIAGTFGSLFNTTKASEVAKFAPHARFLVLATAICGLSIAGFPLFVGHISKDLMVTADLQNHNYGALTCLVIGSLLNYIYIFPIIKAGIMEKKIPNYVGKSIPLSMKLAISLSTFLILITSYYSAWLVSWLKL